MPVPGSCAFNLYPNTQNAHLIRGRHHASRVAMQSPRYGMGLEFTARRRGRCTYMAAGAPTSCSEKRVNRNGVGSTIGSSLAIRSAASRPAPGPTPNPCPLKPDATYRPGNCGTGPIVATASGVESIQLPQAWETPIPDSSGKLSINAFMASSTVFASGAGLSTRIFSKGETLFRVHRAKASGRLSRNG